MGALIDCVSVSLTRKRVSQVPTNNHGTFLAAHPGLEPTRVDTDDVDAVLGQVEGEVLGEHVHPRLAHAVRVVAALTVRFFLVNGTVNGQVI